MKCNFQRRLQRVEYEGLSDVLSDVRDIMEILHKDGGSVAIVCRGEEAEFIIKDMMDYDFAVLDFNAVDYKGEYLVELTSDFELYCEPCIRSDGSIPAIEGSDVVFTFEDVDPEIVERIDSPVVIYSI